MTHANDDDGLEIQARRRYRAAAGDLDYATRSALARARGEAVAGRRPARAIWIPAAGVTAAAGALAAVWLSGQSPDTASVPVETMVEDFELLIDREALDLAADLDFYLWLESQPDVG